MQEYYVIVSLELAQEHQLKEHNITNKDSTTYSVHVHVRITSIVHCMCNVYLTLAGAIKLT